MYKLGRAGIIRGYKYHENARFLMVMPMKIWVELSPNFGENVVLEL